MSAVYASLAGSLFVHNLGYIIGGEFGFLASVKLVVMAVIGGLASIGGAIFGAGVITALNNELLVKLTQIWPKLVNIDIVIYGLILVVVMILTPEGLFVAMRSGTIWLKSNWKNLPHILKEGCSNLPANLKRVFARRFSRFRLRRNAS